MSFNTGADDETLKSLDLIGASERELANKGERESLTRDLSVSRGHSGRRRSDKL